MEPNEVTSRIEFEALWAELIVQSYDDHGYNSRVSLWASDSVSPKRTDSKWPHGRALGVDLVDVGEPSCERIWGDLVAMLVLEVSGFRTGSGDLGASIGCSPNIRAHFQIARRVT